MDKDRLIENLRIYQEELRMQYIQLQSSIADLEHEKQKFEALYEHSPAPYLTLTQTGNITKLNAAAARLLGLPRHQVRFTSFFPYLSSGSRNDFRKFLLEVFSGDQPVSAECDLLEEQERARPMLLQGTVYWDKEQTAPLCQLALADLTRQRSPEASLRESVEMVFETSSDTIIVIDKHQKIRMFNRSAERMFGYQREEIIGQSVTRLMPEGYRRGHAAHVHAFGSRSKPGQSQFSQVNGLRKGGEEFPIEASLGMFHQDGEPMFSAFIRDATLKHRHLAQIEASERRLAELNSSKDLFLNILSHDLRSPFTTILGFVEMLKEKHGQYDFERRDRLIGHLEESARGAFSLLENLLQWSRSESGNIAFHPRPIELKPHLALVFNSMGPTAKRRGVALIDRVALGQQVLADPDMLRAIVRNLVSNALRFTPEGGEVVVASEAIEGWGQLCLSVRDTGVGMNPEQVARLFDIGQKRALPDLDGKQGSGLGLVLCGQFARKHGSQLEVESEPGRGSVFRFCLPLAEKVAQDVSA